ncbi:MAG: orotidine-5'-phosphate decarboxylase [Bauldia sp.]|nr:orotidine-5'-phosphate decarboxylase [Bauldia sp.]
MAIPLTPKERLIVALDLPTVAEAEAMVTQLRDEVGVFKIGLQLAFAGGADLARRLAVEGYAVFFDVKLLDIGQTVEHAVRSIIGLGVTFVTIHGYPQAMRAAVAARGDAPLRLLGVSVLTSMDESDFAQAGYFGRIREQVIARAGDAKAAGMDGIVAAPSEAAAVREVVGPDMLIITPGVRPAGTDAGDQKRVATPAEAIAAGADYLVVGRPILTAPDPATAARAIVAEIAAALRRPSP